MEHLRDFGVDIEEVEYAIKLCKQKKCIGRAGQDPRYHEHVYCDYDDHYDDIKYIIRAENDGISNTQPVKVSDTEWIVYCTCGHIMELKEMKRDYVVPAWCHCGMRLGHYKVKTWKIVYMCPRCQNTHEAHQKDVMFKNEGVLHKKGEPLGMMKIPREYCHVARFRISDCIKAMKLLQKQTY